MTTKPSQSFFLFLALSAAMVTVSPAGGNMTLGQERLFFNFRLPWFPLPWLNRATTTAATLPNCPTSSVATVACTCGAVQCSIGHFCHTTTSSSVCSTLASCPATATTSTCSCGSATCVSRQTCTAATSVCFPPVCTPDVLTGTCLCGTLLTCQANQFCSSTTGTCTLLAACPATATVPCTCGTAICSIGQTCPAGATTCGAVVG